MKNKGKFFAVLSTVSVFVWKHALEATGKVVLVYDFGKWFIS
jgi:hypothetical protein